MREGSRKNSRKKSKEKEVRWWGERIRAKELEAATGFEPVNNGFADRCLSHLAMPPLFSGAGNGT